MDTETLKTKKRIAYVLDGNGKPEVQKKTNGHAASHSATVKTTKGPVFRVIRGGCTQ